MGGGVPTSGTFNSTAYFNLHALGAAASPLDRTQCSVSSTTSNNASITTYGNSDEGDYGNDDEQLAGAKDGLPQKENGGRGGSNNNSSSSGAPNDIIANSGSNGEGTTSPAPVTERRPKNFESYEPVITPRAAEQPLVDDDDGRVALRKRHRQRRHWEAGL